MIITKKHISRRTVLRGIGATLALPFLDSMVPAATALTQTAANPKPRFVAASFPMAARPAIGFQAPKVPLPPSFHSITNRWNRFGTKR